MSIFAKKSQLRELVVQAVLKDRKDQSAKHIAALHALEDRLNGEAELKIQTLQAKIELLQQEVSNNKKFMSDVEEAYAFCWDMINKNDEVAGYFSNAKDKVEKHFGYIFQAIKSAGDKAINNKQQMIDKDQIIRDKLRYNSRTETKQVT